MGRVKAGMFTSELFVDTGDAKSLNIPSAEVEESMEILQDLHIGGVASIVVDLKKG